MPRYREWDLACKVYVGNLGSSASKYEIENAFSKYGPLRNVWVARNPPGFAFVEFEDRRDAEDATRGLDGTRCCGTRIRVEMSSGRSRRDDRRRGGGGGGGGGSTSGRGGGRYRIKSTATSTTTRTSKSSSFNKTNKNIFTYHNCSSTNFTTTSYYQLNIITFSENSHREKFLNLQFFEKAYQQNFDNSFSYNCDHHNFQHHQKQLQYKPQHKTFISKIKIIVFVKYTNTTLNNTTTNNNNVTRFLHIDPSLVFAVAIAIKNYISIVVATENSISCCGLKYNLRSTVIRHGTRTTAAATPTTTTILITSKIFSITTATTPSAATASTVTTNIPTATSKSGLAQQPLDQQQQLKHLKQPSSLIPLLLSPQPP